MDIYKQYNNLVRQCCYSYEKDRDALEDLIQDVWVEVYHSIDNYNGSSEISTWIWAVAQNVCRNYVRNISRQPELIRESDIEDVDKDYVDEVMLQRVPTPDEWYEAEEFSDELDVVVGKFPKRMKQIYYLAFVEGYAPSDIVEELDLSPNQVYTQLYRIRKTIEDSCGLTEVFNTT